MKRRCSFLDRCPAFNFNGGSTEYIPSSDGKKKVKNDTTQLGSTLMETMLREVSDFCDPIIRENWSLKPHHQVRRQDLVVAIVLVDVAIVMCVVGSRDHGDGGYCHKSKVDPRIMFIRTLGGRGGGFDKNLYQLSVIV